MPLGVASTWLSLRVDSTEAYVDTVAPLADDEELRDRLSESLATAAIGTLQDNVPIALPDTLGEVVRASTREVVENDSFPEFWRQANAKAHREFLAIVHEDEENVVADGWVFIDVGPLLDQVLRDAAKDLGIPNRLVPSAPLMLPVVPESKLEEVRGGYQVLEGLSFWVPLVWLALVVVAVAAAHGLRGRLRATAACALGAAIGAGLVLLLTAPTTDVVVDQVEPDKQELVRLVVEVVVSNLDGAALGVVVAGLLVGVALLLGSLIPGRRRPSPTY